MYVYVLCLTRVYFQHIIQPNFILFPRHKFELFYVKRNSGGLAAIYWLLSLQNFFSEINVHITKP